MSDEQRDSLVETVGHATAANGAVDAVITLDGNKKPVVTSTGSNGDVNVEAGGKIQWSAGSEITRYLVLMKGPETPFANGEFWVGGKGKVTAGIGKKQGPYPYGVHCWDAEGGPYMLDPDIVVGPSRDNS